MDAGLFAARALRGVDGRLVLGRRGETGRVGYCLFSSFAFHLLAGRIKQGYFLVFHGSVAVSRFAVFDP